MTYSNFLFVQLLTDFTKNVIGTKPDIIATGNSASFVLMACNMEPEYFNKIIIINPAPLEELAKTPNKRKNTLKFLLDLPVFGTMVYNLAFSQRSIRQTFQKYFYKEHMVPSRIIDTYYEAAHMENSRGKYLLSSIKANYTNINIVHALKKINNSIYLIGSKGNENMGRIIDSYISYNPSIESSFVGDSKYLAQLETPEKLIDILNLYLDPVK